MLNAFSDPCDLLNRTSRLIGESKYLDNWSVIVVSITLIWREAAAAIHITAMKL